MTAPIFFKPTTLSTDPTGAEVGSAAWKYVVDVLDGSIADRIQQIKIEGLSPVFGYKVVMYKSGTLHYAYKDDGTQVIAPNTNARTVLQAAIDSINSAGGGKLLIKDGIYTITSQWLVYSNIEVWGESREKTILKSGSPLLTSQMKNADSTNGNTNITLANLTIDHIDVATGDNNGACVNWFKVSKSVMFNCHIKNGASYTVFWSSGGVDMPDNIVTHCIFDCDERSPKPNWDMFGGGNLADSIVCNNIFRNSKGSGLFVIRTPRRLIFANNVVYGGEASGISLETGYESIIAINTVYNCTSEGIKVLDSVNGTGWQCQILGNRISTCGNRGISVLGENHIINNNFVFDNQLTGIEIGSASHNCIINGNISKNNGKDTGALNTHRVGIRLNGVTDCLVTGNRCHDNQGTKTQLNGILEAGTADFNLIVANNTRGNSSTGIVTVGANTVNANNLV